MKEQAQRSRRPKGEIIQARSDLITLEKNRRMLSGVKWFLVVILGCLVWAYLIVILHRRNSAEFERKARKARKFSSRILHGQFKR
jgi:hypothetical protein